MNEPDKREKVIKGLECCSAYDYRCNDCPYQDDGVEDDCYSDELYADALALLKAQEPRVMSVQEVKQLKHGVLVAYEARGLQLGDDGKHHMTIVCHAAEFETIDSRGVIWFHGGIGIEGFKNYGRVFRVWTSRPTDEQREAVKWR